MRTLMDDRGLRPRLAERGREVAARYTWEASARRHLAVYRAVSLKRS